MKLTGDSTSGNPGPIYLMRHGETEWNRVRRMQGRLNSALTDRGQAQARALGALMDGVHAPIWCSASGRAVQTAALAFGDRHEPITTDPRLMEIDIGAFSGRLLSEVQAERPDLFESHDLSWYDHAPGGEGFAGLETRCRSFLADLSGPAIVVTHGITLRMLRSLLMHGDDRTLEQGDRVAQGVIWRFDGALTRIEMSDTGPTAGATSGPVERPG